MSIEINEFYLSGSEVAERIGISKRTLIVLGESGEFELGRVSGEIIISKESFLDYLDRSHLKKKESESEETAFDGKGNLKLKLTYVKEKHTDIPVLKKIEEYSQQLNMDKRSFIRNCDVGNFIHYRIGTAYKMSEEDFLNSLKLITEKGTKSNRGQNAGRPKKIEPVEEVEPSRK